MVWGKCRVYITITVGLKFRSKVGVISRCGVLLGFRDRGWGQSLGRGRGLGKS